MNKYTLLIVGIVLFSFGVVFVMWKYDKPDKVSGGGVSYNVNDSTSDWHIQIDTASIYTYQDNWQTEPTTHAERMEQKLDSIIKLLNKNHK